MGRKRFVPGLLVGALALAPGLRAQAEDGAREAGDRARQVTAAARRGDAGEEPTTDTSNSPTSGKRGRSAGGGRARRAGNAGYAGTRALEGFRRSTFRKFVRSQGRIGASLDRIARRFEARLRGTTRGSRAGQAATRTSGAALGYLGFAAMATSMRFLELQTLEARGLLSREEKWARTRAFFLDRRILKEYVTYVGLEAGLSLSAARLEARLGSVLGPSTLGKQALRNGLVAAIALGLLETGKGCLRGMMDPPWTRGLSPDASLEERDAAFERYAEGAPARAVLTGLTSACGEGVRNLRWARMVATMAVGFAGAAIGTYVGGPVGAFVGFVAAAVLLPVLEHFLVTPYERWREDVRLEEATRRALEAVDALGRAAGAPSEEDAGRFQATHVRDLAGKLLESIEASEASHDAAREALASLATAELGRGVLEDLAAREEAAPARTRYDHLLGTIDALRGDLDERNPALAARVGRQLEAIEAGDPTAFLPGLRRVLASRLDREDPGDLLAVVEDAIEAKLASIGLGRDAGRPRTRDLARASLAVLANHLASLVLRARELREDRGRTRHLATQARWVTYSAAATHRARIVARLKALDPALLVDQARRHHPDLLRSEAGRALARAVDFHSMKSRGAPSSIRRGALRARIAEAARLLAELREIEGSLARIQDAHGPRLGAPARIRLVRGADRIRKDLATSKGIVQEAGAGLSRAVEEETARMRELFPELVAAIEGIEITVGEDGLRTLVEEPAETPVLDRLTRPGSASPFGLGWMGATREPVALPAGWDGTPIRAADLRPWDIRIGTRSFSGPTHVAADQKVRDFLRRLPRIEAYYPLLAFVRERFGADAPAVLVQAADRYEDRFREVTGVELDPSWVASAIYTRTAEAVRDGRGKELHFLEAARLRGQAAARALEERSGEGGGGAGEVLPGLARRPAGPVLRRPDRASDHDRALGAYRRARHLAGRVGFLEDVARHHGTRMEELSKELDPTAVGSPTDFGRLGTPSMRGR